jgi:beta-glucosidase
MPWLDSVKAVVEAWYPGQEGGRAIADVLTGAVNPSGHLPISFPADETQTPRPQIFGLGEPDGTPVRIDYSEGSNVGYRWFAAKNLKPLFAFGHGLSYTRFAYDALKLNSGGTLTARITVRNIGARFGADVPQLYLVSAAGQPLQRLAAFSRVELQPGTSRTITLDIDPRLLAHWDTAGNGWRIDAGNYEFALGASAADLRQHATIALGKRMLKP